MFFSVAPDLDLIWFYTLGARSVPHHHYVTHWPLAWAAAFGLAWLASVALDRPQWKPSIAIGFAAVMVHLALDSVAAEIYWLAPFSGWSLNLFTIPAVHDWWVWNFVLHWTFAIETGICLLAAMVFMRSRRSSVRLQ